MARIAVKNINEPRYEVQLTLSEDEAICLATVIDIIKFSTVNGPSEFLVDLVDKLPPAYHEKFFAKNHSASISMINFKEEKE